jgi:hypothetical protein
MCVGYVDPESPEALLAFTNELHSLTMQSQSNAPSQLPVRGFYNDYSAMKTWRTSLRHVRELNAVERDSLDVEHMIHDKLCTQLSNNLAKAYINGKYAYSKEVKKHIVAMVSTLYSARAKQTVIMWEQQRSECSTMHVIKCVRHPYSTHKIYSLARLAWFG